MMVEHKQRGDKMVVDVDKQAEKITKAFEKAQEDFFTNIAPIFMDEIEFDDFSFEDWAIQKEREEAE
jgi:hypothetical protein